MDYSINHNSQLHVEFGRDMKDLSLKKAKHYFAIFTEDKKIIQFFPILVNIFNKFTINKIIVC